MLSNENNKKSCEFSMATLRLFISESQTEMAEHTVAMAGPSTGQSIPDTPMQNFFNGRSIFLTGGSGFLGKVLLEKLVRSCHGLKHIYCLIRSKDNETPRQRLDKLFEAPVSTHNCPLLFIPSIN